MAHYNYKIKKIYPTATDDDFQLEDHGQGPVIATWNTGKLGVEPTLASLDAAITDQSVLDDIQAMPNRRRDDIAALGTRAELIQEINDLANASPPMKAILRKLAKVIYNREKGTID
ncbi:MAG: hypothetical protein GY941_16570 [Planctomycetes bacterium]|nr:hypothetical protein [Planctomycetota bacterium]